MRCLVLCSVLGALSSFAIAVCAPSPGACLSPDESGLIRGGDFRYCSQPINMTGTDIGGCSACVYMGWWTYTVPSPPAPFPYTYSIQVWKRCNPNLADALCYDSNYTQNPSPTCSRDPALCPNGSNAYSDGMCSNQIFMTPSYICSAGTYQFGTGGTAAGVNCSGITPGYH
jgi:hypothetical protein